MLSPTKITLIGAVLFALQQTHYLPLQKHHLMLIYTVFTVVNKVSVRGLFGIARAWHCDFENILYTQGGSDSDTEQEGVFWST